MSYQEKELPEASSVVLLTIDGWDCNWRQHKLFSRVETPNLEELLSSYPAAAFNISDKKESRKDRMDLAEKGYYALGTGAEMYSARDFIDRSIRDKTFFHNKALVGAMDNARKNNSQLHLLGLASDAEKYSSLNHLKNLLKMARQNKLNKVYLHIILDGRDTAPDKGIEFIKKIKKYIQQFGVGEIATIHGSFYAMDRNNNWERVAKSYRTLTGVDGKTGQDPEEVIRENYNKEIYDKEIPPTIITDHGDPKAKIQESDSVIFFNIGGDRSRELTKAFVMSGWGKIPDRKYIKDLYFVCFTEYEKHLPIKIAFPKTGSPACLSEKLDNEGCPHLKISGVEKYPHWNYFFNGERSYQFSFEERELIAPEEEGGIWEEKKEATRETAEKVIRYIKQGQYRFLAANLGNFDSFKLITGKKDRERIIKYIEEIDFYIKKIYKMARNKDAFLFITSASNLAAGKKAAAPVPLVAVHKKIEGKALWPQSLSQDLRVKGISGDLKDIKEIILNVLVKNKDSLSDEK